MSARALIGGGSASLTSTLVAPEPNPVPLPAARRSRLEPPSRLGSLGAGLARLAGPAGLRQDSSSHDGYFVAEPQVNVNFKINGWIHVSAGGGYRFVDGTRDMDHRLRGASGSLSVQLGGGS